MRPRDSGFSQGVGTILGTAHGLGLTMGALRVRSVDMDDVPVPSAPGGGRRTAPLASGLHPRRKQTPSNVVKCLLAEPPPAV